MSPAATKRKRENVKRAAEWSVRGKGKSESGEGFGNSYAKVKVVRDAVEVTWLDGTSCATRRFTAHSLKELISYIDGPASRYHDVWLRLRDNSMREFYLQLGEDGRLTANTSPVFHGSVDWGDLKHGFEEALAELDSDQEEAAKA